uniref:Polysaccharide biosynthesis protein CapD n=1 Tax=Solibacter usitatus (strain Ellin6076) TaxID=234267 RepID=Q01WZ5_SOLUE
MKNHRNIDVWLERACHLTVVGLSLTAAFLLRFDFAIPASVVPIWKQALLIAILVKLPIFDWVGFYRSLRRFVSIPDLYLVFLGNVAGSLLLAAMSMFFTGPAMPRSVLIMDGILCFVATALVRFSVRIYNATFRERSAEQRTGILIYGAGAAGAELAREIHANRNTKYEVKGFLDDDPLKQNARIMGIPVLGQGREAYSVVRQRNRRGPSVGEIIIAMPSATGQQMRETLANCRAAGVPCKTIPGIDELLSGRVLLAQVRNPSVQDLLGRQQVRLDEAHVAASIAGRSVLVTGAAGSIGSELCRQVARFGPGCLIAFDQAESDLFRIENELRERYPELELVTALGNIREAERLSEVMRQHAVESIFHAAAYKHVPMMESHPLEAVCNNVLGTWNLVRAARGHNVRNLLMISSDKAVNPSCVMGATKRVCERIVSSRWPGNGQTKCVSVRFGNVLGSNGSVVPVFQAQIAAGGPIKVTHPDARRFFMTISEAVSLVIQASTRTEGSEIFVLDMGEPIRIVDLAENMIRLAGKVPYEDIDIQFTGMRPGEKLMEEIRGKSERLIPTSMEKMHAIQEQPLVWDKINGWIEELKELIAERQERRIIAHLQTLVPEYTPSMRGAPQPVIMLPVKRPSELRSA